MKCKECGKRMSVRKNLKTDRAENVNHAWCKRCGKVWITATVIRKTQYAVIGFTMVKQ